MVEKTKKAADIAGMASALVREHIKKPFESVIGIAKEKGGGWRMLVEVTERKAVPDTQDLVGRYEISISDDGELQGFHQVRVRRRADREGIELSA